MFPDQNNPQPPPNPLQGLLSLLGPSAANTPQPPTPQAAPQAPLPNPAGAAGAVPVQAPAAPAPQPQMNPVISGLMQQSQAAMANPMGQAVPQAGGLIDALKHPLVAGLIKALGQAAQSYGWTAMMPQEREERTQLQQQKAETLARLAETGAYQEGMLGLRGRQVDVNQQKADTAAAGEASLADYRKFEQQNAQDKLELAKDANDWKQAMAAGRLDKAQQLIDQKASQFEQKFQLAQKQFGLEETKTALQGEGMGIKQGMLDLAKTALAQRGTEQGAQMLSKIQQFKIEHPIMSQFMDMSDLDQLVGGAGATGLPGVTQVAPSPQPTPTGVPTPASPPQGKAAAKRNQQAAPSSNSGVTHVYVPGQGIQPVGGQP